MRQEEKWDNDTIFGDVRSLMRYEVFDSWEKLLYFVAVGLEVEFPP